MSKYETAAPEGQPTHVPAVRIVGVETGSDRYHELLDKYHGALGQFQLGQQQQVLLSGQRYYKATRAVPGGHMTYQNNDGQETITLELATSGGEEKVEESKEEYWQWAIVETTIPDMTKTSAEMAVFMNPKPKPPKVGVSWEENFVYDFDKPPLAYPGDVLSFSDELQVLTGQTDQVSSVRVDLRPYPGGVKFDLYGFIYSYIDPDGLGPIVGSTWRAGRNANTPTWTGTWHSSVGGSGSMPAAGDISGRTLGDVYYANTLPSLVNDDFPDTIGATFNHTTMGGLGFLFAPAGAFGAQGPSYTGISFTWTPGSGNMPTTASLDVGGLISAAGGLFAETTTTYPGGFTKLVRGIGAMDSNAGGALNGRGPVDADGTWGISFFDYSLYHTSDHSALTVYPDRRAPIRFSVFDGEEPNAYTGLTGVSGGFGSRKRWEDAKRGIAKRWPFKQIAVGNIKAIDAPGDTSIGNHFGMIKIGTVIINPKKGKGGIKFIAA